MPKPNPPESWLAGWQALQEQFARAWKDAAGAPGATPPMQEGFEQWARMAGGGASGNEAVDRMVAGARQMVQMMQAGLSAASGKAAPSGVDWASAISSALGGLGPQDNPMRDALREAMGQGARGFEQLFGDFAAAAAPLRQDFQALMHLPAFGYARESQERQQRFALAPVLTEPRQQQGRKLFKVDIPRHGPAPEAQGLGRRIIVDGSGGVAGEVDRAAQGSRQHAVKGFVGKGFSRHAGLP